MSPTRLSDLDQRTVAIEMEIGTRQTVLRGVARFDASDAAGPALLVQVNDPAGNFEIRLDEQVFNGKVASGKSHGCDYHIHLGKSLVTR